MTVYVDVILLENLFMNYIILFATGVILKAPIKIIRTFISSLIGSMYSVLSYMSALEIYSSMALKIILSISMVFIAFNASRLKTMFKQLMIFYLTSFTFGGVAFALLYFIKPQNIILENGVLIGTYSIKIILIGGVIGFTIITTAFKSIKGKFTKKDMFCDLKISINSNFIYLRAIIDTGNFLKEPITKTPVIVVGREDLKGVLPNKILNNIQNIINGEDVELDEYISRIRFIPFSSLGKENGLLVGIKADNVIINLEESVCIDNIIIAIYDGVLNKNGNYKALIGLDAIENKGGIKSEYSTDFKI